MAPLALVGRRLELHAERLALGHRALLQRALARRLELLGELDLRLVGAERGEPAATVPSRSPALASASASASAAASAFAVGPGNTTPSASSRESVGVASELSQLLSISGDAKELRGRLSAAARPAPPGAKAVDAASTSMAADVAAVRCVGRWKSAAVVGHTDDPQRC